MRYDLRAYNDIVHATVLPSMHQCRLNSTEMPHDQLQLNESLPPYKFQAIDDEL